MLIRRSNSVELVRAPDPNYNGEDLRTLNRLKKESLPNSEFYHMCSKDPTLLWFVVVGKLLRYREM
jgi:hypothetical protein